MCLGSVSCSLHKHTVIPYSKYLELSYLGLNLQVYPMTVEVGGRKEIEGWFDQSAQGLLAARSRRVGRDFPT